MTPYVRQILDDWEMPTDLQGRRAHILKSPKGELPYHTVKRIISCFDFPEGMHDYCMHFGEFLNCPDTLSDNPLECITPPNEDGAAVFRTEFELTKVLYICFDLSIDKKPQSREAQRAYKAIRKGLKKPLDDIRLALNRLERHKKALILSSMGAKMLWLDKNLSSLLSEIDGSPSKLQEYEGYGSKNQLRDGAVLSLAYSYFYCFGQMPTTSDGSTFAQYTKRMVTHYKEDKLVEFAEDTLNGIVDKAVAKLKKALPTA